MLQFRTKVVGKVVQLNNSSLNFNFQNRVFSLLLITPVSPIPCWDITEQLPHEHSCFTQH